MKYSAVCRMQTMLLVLLRRKVTILRPSSHLRLFPAFCSNSPGLHCHRSLPQRAGGNLVSTSPRRAQSVSDRSMHLFGFVAKLFRSGRNLSRGCKILKQLADRTKVETQLAHERANCDSRRDFAAHQTLVSRSEAKFFLDTPGQSQYVDRKFFGAPSERSKFHLLAPSDLLNCRTYSGGGLFSSSTRIFARLRKAESRKQGLERQSKQQTKASGKKRALGFFLFPADMEEGSFTMNRMQVNEGGKGDGHIA